jgi:hypothetical protein
LFLGGFKHRIQTKKTLKTAHPYPLIGTSSLGNDGLLEAVRPELSGFFESKPI